MASPVASSIRQPESPQIEPETPKNQGEVEGKTGPVQSPEEMHKKEPLDQPAKKDSDEKPSMDEVDVKTEDRYGSVVSTVETDQSLSQEEPTEEEEEGECGFCLFMKGGGCKDQFIAWEKCVEEGEMKKEDIVEKCYTVTSLLKDCMDRHSDYYEPVLRAEREMDEQVAAEMNQESSEDKEKTSQTDTNDSEAKETGEADELPERAVAKDVAGEIKLYNSEGKGKTTQNVKSYSESQGPRKADELAETAIDEHAAIQIRQKNSMNTEESTQNYTNKSEPPKLGREQGTEKHVAARHISEDKGQTPQNDKYISEPKEQGTPGELPENPPERAMDKRVAARIKQLNSEEKVESRQNAANSSEYKGPGKVDELTEKWQGTAMDEHVPAGSKQNTEDEEKTTLNDANNRETADSGKADELPGNHRWVQNVISYLFS